MQIIIDGKVVKVPSGGGTDFTVDPTLTMSDENVLSVTVPTKSATKEEYNALTDDEKKGLWVVTDETDTIVSSGGSNNVYSKEETVIGTWFDKPLYRKIIDFQAGDVNAEKTTGPFPDIDVMTNIRAIVVGKAGSYLYLPNTFSYIVFGMSDKTIYSMVSSNDAANQWGYAILEYTKSTD